MNASSDELERAVLRFHSAIDPVTRESAFRELMSQQVRPLLLKLVSGQLASFGRSDPELAEDIASVAMLSLLKRFKSASLPDNFQAYVQTVARNAVRHGSRSLSTSRSLIARATLGAISAMSDVSLTSSKTERYVQLNGQKGYKSDVPFDPEAVVNWCIEKGRDPSSATYDRLVRWALEYSRQDLNFKDIVTFIMRAMGKFDIQIVSITSDSAETRNLEDQISSTVPAPDRTIETRVFLREVVTALGHLKPNYVRCLLLNFNEDLDCLSELFKERDEFRGELARVMDISVDHLNEIWQDLPWTDSRIASWLKCEEIDVSNYRMMARRKLKKLLQAWYGGNEI
jgi:RNA polymerase sigma factor (sigma-70 family)